jgi:hypothetical protein
MISLSPILTSLTIAAGLALGIERTLELLKNIMDQSKGVVDLRDVINRARSAVAEVEQYLRSPTPPLPAEVPAEPPAPDIGSPISFVPAAATVTDNQPDERYPAPRITVQPAVGTTIQQASKVLFLQLFAAGLGILLAHYFKIQLVTIFLQGLGHKPSAFFQALDFFQGIDIILSGLVIGGGSQAIHVLIRFLTERKVSVGKETAEVTAETTTPLAETIMAGSFKAEIAEVKETPTQEWAWKDLVYLGGVNPTSLETTHRRSGAPNLIVYHHTAMSSNAPFKDVVDEFLVSKKWLTGYHCVIMPDGKVEPFCRWDRSGNHAKGLNDRSLGVSFHGNFHTDLNDRYSNADGRYGNQQPTEAQLHAGARLVALWALLYKDIALDFSQHILPHKKAMPGHTVCPGSNFPYEKFEPLVRSYYTAWSTSPEALQKIRDFSQLKYIHA